MQIQTITQFFYKHIRMYTVENMGGISVGEEVDHAFSYINRDDWYKHFNFLVLSIKAENMHSL